MESAVARFESDRYAKNGARREKSAQRVVGELLLRFGIAPHLSGFDPLCGAIRITTERGRFSALPKMSGVHQMIRSLCGENNPEHALHDAITVGFLEAGEAHTQIFPFSNHPSIAEFVCTLAELARDRILPG